MIVIGSNIYKMLRYERRAEDCAGQRFVDRPSRALSRFDSSETPSLGHDKGIEAAVHTGEASDWAAVVFAERAKMAPAHASRPPEAGPAAVDDAPRASPLCTTNLPNP